MGDDGSADLQYVLAVAKSIGETMQKDWLLLINLRFQLVQQIK